MLVLVAVVQNGVGERDGEISVVLSSPAVRDAIARQQRVVFNTKIAPKRLAIVVVDAVSEVENELRILCWESVLMHANALCGSQLCQDVVVIEFYLVVARRTMFRFVREARTITCLRIVGSAWISLNLACRRHDEDVAQVAVTRAREVCVREAYDCLVAMLITSAVLIDFALIASVHVVRDGVCLWRELYDAEWHAGSGESVSHAVCADDWVDVVYDIL